jgi:hypothetical protein
MLTSRDILRLWKLAKDYAERDGFRPGDFGYHTAARIYFEGFVKEVEESEINRQLSLKYNPPEVDDKLYRLYVKFHGVEPEKITDTKISQTGEMVLLGKGMDTGYQVVDVRSNKGKSRYVHDFGNGVKAYRKARPGEHPDKILDGHSQSLMVLGKALGFTYRNNDGELVEVAGGNRKLTTTPDGRMLLLIGRNIDYLLVGGNMRVEDWIRD